MSGFVIADGFQEWRGMADEMSVAEVRAAYDAGFAGAFGQPEARARFRDNVKAAGFDPDGEATATAWGLAGRAVGGLHVPYVYACDAYGALVFPGRAQGRGDCVSRGTANGATLTLGVELFLQRPDPVSGIIEGFPQLAPEALDNGVLSSEVIYWWRQHGGEGSSCALLADALCHNSGMWLRQPYPDLGLDLTTYSARTAGLYGSRTPPDNLRAVGQSHLMRTATEPEGWEAAADFLANGHGVNSCGGQAWSDDRDENGFSPTTNGGWAHSEAYIAADWRPWVAQKYNVPALFLMLNSWGPNWNQGPRDIYDSAQYVPASKRERWVALGLVNPTTGNLLIPPGSRWVSCKTVAQRYLVAFSGAAGWPARDLVNMSFASG